LELIPWSRSKSLSCTWYSTIYRGAFAEHEYTNYTTHQHNRQHCHIFTNTRQQVHPRSLSTAPGSFPVPFSPSSAAGNLLSHPSARSHIPPRIQAACKSNGAKDQRRPPFQLRPRSPSFVSACVYACGERSRSHCPECRGCRTPSGVLPSPECQGLRQASGTRLSVLQPSGAWLALHRWL
jgi:hypothetical protein